jgi:predicted ATPase
MRLLRVEVPNFKALKDVDISFELDFHPQVFPLGSLNGGGKSTLLQLIFVLLNYIGNLQLPQLQKIRQLQQQIRLLKQRIQIIQQQQQQIDHLQLEQLEQLELEQIKLQQQQQQRYVINMLAELKINDSETIHSLATITLILNNEKFKLEFFYGNSYIVNNLNVFYTLLQDNVVFYCLINSEDITSHKFYTLQQEISKKLFLITQPNQPYLLLDRNTRRSLFTANNKLSYDETVRNLQLTLPSFFTFDFTDVLTEVCRLARDKDFDEQLKTGCYGTHYIELEKSINSLFVDGKKIVPLTIKQKRHQTDSIQSMGFKLPSGEEIYPEDLSHGELKRLTIFVLIKYHEMQDAIVLIDEIENGFHPDWQYQIVRDLVEWGKNNQYILATHSYELCTAVTPAHVKELEPRLIK